MKVTLDLRSATIGLVLGIGAALAMGQYAPAPAGSGGAARVTATSAGRYQLVASDGRMFVFDTAARQMWNVRVDPKSMDFMTLTPAVFLNSDPSTPMVAPLITPGGGTSKAPNKTILDAERGR